MKIFSMIKRIIYGEKYSSETYIASLKRKGYKIGDRCTFYNPQSTVLDSTPYMLEIGNDVKITAGVNILCHDASVFVLDRAGEGYYSAPAVFGKTIIGNNVFIGRNAIILKGTKIGDNVIIGAGSVVVGNIESDSVYAGNPARRISTLHDFNEKCAKRCVSSAKEYALSLQSSLGRVPDISEMYEGYHLLFEPNEFYPSFSSVKELIEYGGDE